MKASWRNNRQHRHEFTQPGLATADGPGSGSGYYLDEVRRCSCGKQKKLFRTWVPPPPNDDPGSARRAVDIWLEIQTIRLLAEYHGAAVSAAELDQLDREMQDLIAAGERGDRAGRLYVGNKSIRCADRRAVRQWRRWRQFRAQP